MAGVYNIVAKQGDTFRMNFRVETAGTPWNLSTYTAQLQVRESEISATPLISVTTSNGITMTSEGHVSIVVPASTMSAVPAGRWFYVFEVISTGNEHTTLLEGRFIVNPEVSI